MVGDKANRPIELTYALPAELSGLKTISVTIPAAEARQLLARFDPQYPERHTCGGNFALLAVIQTHRYFFSLFVSRKAGSQAGILEGIEDHCSDSMKVDFGRLDLTRAGCAAWYIACEGKLKVGFAAFVSGPDVHHCILICRSLLFQIFPPLFKTNHLRTFLQALENPDG